ncbi:hypothetical protein GCM10009682_11080 [Luedemannella flava]|uniref:Uncharacterized protein n=1 Tax=Luedemannella flava TaxID=349316 RepID=A0ABP4XPW3_9ACTN
MDDSGGVSNPYAAQTAANTNVNWPDSIDNVKADFASMSTYAENMYKASLDLMSTMPTIQQSMPKLATDGFLNVGEGATLFPEASLANMFVSHNQADFMAMMRDLQVSMQNIGYAAQTISDAYGLTDGSSAGDLNAITVDGVEFAFGRGGERPKGLPSNIGKTYQQLLAESGGEAGANAGAVTGATDPSMLGGTQTVVVSGIPGHQMTTRTISYPDGSRIVISTWETPYGTQPPQTFTRYTVYGTDNKATSSTLKTATEQNGTTTVVTQADGSSGHSTQTTSSAYVNGEKVTTTTNSSTSDKGVTTAGTTTTVTQHTDGSVTTASTTPHSDGTSSTTTLDVGDNDTDLGDISGQNNPKQYADETYGSYRPDYA